MKKKLEEKIETQEDVAKRLAEEELDAGEETGLNFMEILSSPEVASLLSGCKDLLKKKETDPNMCEITIKAPSEVVLKLFNVE